MQSRNKYIAIPQNPISIQTLCKSIRYIEIREPSIISSQTDCIIMYDNNVVKIEGTTQPTETIINYSLNFPIAESDMKLLHNFLPTIARVTPNFNNYVNTLDSMNNQQANLKNQR